jgi:hypothetical protein
MKFKLLGGGQIEADSNEQLIKRLNITSLFGYKKDVFQFMKNTADACKTFNGAEIDCSNYDNFVIGLIESGYLTEVEDA